MYATGQQQAHSAEGAYAATCPENVSGGFKPPPAKVDGLDRSRSLRQRGDHGDPEGSPTAAGHRRPGGGPDRSSAQEYADGNGTAAPNRRFYGPGICEQVDEGTAPPSTIP